MSSRLTAWLQSLKPHQWRAIGRQVISIAVYQAVLMVLSAGVGFVIVRTLSKAEYARYALLTNVFSLGITLACMGVVSSFLALIGSKADDTKFVAGRAWSIYRIQWPLYVVAGGAIVVYFGVVSSRNGWLEARYLGSGLAVVVAVWLTVQNRISESIVKVRLNPVAIYQTTIVGELARAGFVMGVFWLAAQQYMAVYPWLACGFCISPAVANWLYRRWKLDVAWRLCVPPPAAEHAETGARFWSLLKPLLFPAYFWQVQDLVTMGMVFVLSGTNTIAEVAAMGRLMAIFILIDKSVELILVPRLAQIDDMRRFTRRVLLAVGIVAAILLPAFLSSIFVPEAWIWLLGSAYGNVAPVLKWMVLVACVERINGCIMWGLVAKGVVRRQWISSVLGLCAQACSALLFGVSTTQGAVFLLLSRALATITVQLLLLASAYRNAPRQPVA